MMNKELKKVIIKSSLGVIVLGIALGLMGFSLSGFETNKYESTHKEWYQVLSFQNLGDFKK